MSNFVKRFKGFRCCAYFKRDTICQHNSLKQNVGLRFKSIDKTRSVSAACPSFTQIRCHSTSSYKTEGPQRPTAQSTIDEEEMQKFTKLSSMWWDEMGSFQALHTMNELRIPLIRNCLQQQQEIPSDPVIRPLQGLRILDAGSGGGILSEPLARLGAFVVGVDMVEDNIKVAQTHLNQDPSIIGQVKYIQAAVEDLVHTENESFDAVVASEVVEHVSSLPTFISSCSQLLKPGGSLFISTINRTLMSRVFAVFGAENILRLVPQGTHDWEKFVTPDELEYHLEDNGISKRMIHGLCYNPLTCRWSWIANTDMNYAVHAVKALDDIDSESQAPVDEDNIKV